MELAQHLSVLVDPAGEVRASYAKMHMFDVEVAASPTARATPSAPATRSSWPTSTARRSA